MHITDIILDGFKSYAVETCVGKFDKHFNAITGLNGTGKSNILDAICFVLGVTSLSTVRATKLEDLISKQKVLEGGLSSARVALILDNYDKSPGICPIGYEDRDEISVSRTIEVKEGHKEIISKYHLNGLGTQKNVIVDLFESVRLDVNNPNFLIMQGKITKVVSMKPKELLQMIEETVGATLYQHKRDKTMRVLENTERQFASLKSVMNDTILPAYELQKIAARDVAEYNLLDAKLKDTENKYAVANYLHSRKRYKQEKHDLQQLYSAEEADGLAIEKHKSNIQDLKQRQKDLKKESEQQVNVQAVEKEMNALTRKHTTDEAKLQSVRSNKKESADKLKKAQVDYNDERRKIEDNKIKQKSMIEEFEQCNAAIERAQKRVNEANEKLDKINIGNIIDEDGNAVNIQQQLIDVEHSIRTLKGPNDMKKRELEMERSAIMEKERTLKNTPTDAQIERDHRLAASEVQRLSNILLQSNIDASELSNLDGSLRTANARLGQIENERHQLLRHYGFLQFTYTPPYAGFDPDLVHGLVYELFQVAEIDKYGIALEVAAGGYFAQVVVENQDVSKQLIARGRLERRTTFLPLNQLRGSKRISQTELDRKLGPKKAFPAIDLVVFNSKYEVLMQNVFGSTVICADQAVAKVVAYQMHRKAVCLDGDVVDPGGTMQGGTRKNAGRMLQACQKLKELKDEKARLKIDVTNLTEKKEARRRNAEVISSHEAATRRLQHCTDLLALTARQTLLDELKSMKQSYTQLEAEIKKVDHEVGNLQKEEKKLRHKIQMENQLREKSKKEMQAELKKWTKELDGATKRKQAKNKLYKEIETDLKATDAMLEGYQKDIDEARKEDEECALALKRKEEEFAKIAAEFRAKMKTHESSIQAKKNFDRQVEEIEETINGTDQRIHKFELAKLKRASKIKQATEKVERRKHSVAEIIEKYPDIRFTDDMPPRSSRSLVALENDLSRLKTNKEDMRARLNFQAAENLPKTRDGVRRFREHVGSIQKRQNFLRDMVYELDKTKAHVVQNAYKSINKEFDFMMNTLLPEAHAKLVPVNPNNIADGVTIHVCLGGTWKESLTELSGGQRSLVALSLVLSLCLYKPAPFYVLDEIDSALDLNHTSNIGYLIRTKFPKVQFICVSLKEGMFNNANVIFSTYFENGTSKVTAQHRTSKAKQTGSTPRRHPLR